MEDLFTRRNFFKLTGASALSAGVLGLSSPIAHAGSEGKPASGDAPDVDAYAFLCGTLKTQTQYMLKDTRVGEPFEVPVPFFLIKHGDDWVAFDTGNNAMVAKDPVQYWGKAVTSVVLPVMKDFDEFKNQIKKLNLEPKQIASAVISHGHLDHAGAVDAFVGTDVPLYFQKTELELIKKAVSAGKKGAYIPEDFKSMDKLNIKAVDGVFDLFGDGTVVAFPTPGHTAGHQSLLVKPTEGPSLVLTADAMYTVENMVDAIPPGIAWDVPQSMQTLAVFKVMNFMDAEVVPAHDPAYWKKQTLAPDSFGA